MSLVEDYDSSSSSEDEDVAGLKMEKKVELGGQQAFSGRDNLEESNDTVGTASSSSQQQQPSNASKGENEGEKEEEEDDDDGQARKKAKFIQPSASSSVDYSTLSKQIKQTVFTLLQRKREKFVNVIDIIKANKHFRNPSIYEQLINRQNINEFGSSVFVVVLTLQFSCVCVLYSSTVAVHGRIKHGPRSVQPQKMD
eukprot:m.36003 g.36003  ORF g.36003 m.36003 type:complete len:197 (+) comp10066_c0_seq1:135-725(+)